MRFSSRPALRSYATVVLTTLSALVASAQAVQTAQQRVRMEPYALVTYVRPDFYNTPASAGVTAGVNVDGIHVLPYMEVGLDVRAASAHSTQISEASLVAGPRISYRRSWLQPYAEYLFGAGRGTFNQSTNPDYVRDYSAIRSYGGGFDVRATRDLSFRADAQYQRWRFTYLAPYFHPVQVSVGVAYHLRLHSRQGPQY